MQNLASQSYVSRLRSLAVNIVIKNVVIKLKVPPKSVRAKLQTSESQEALFLQTIHLADNSPYAYEERWVNVEAVPEILDAPLDEISVNEWLVRTVPFSSGDVIFFC